MLNMKTFFKTNLLKLKNLYFYYFYSKYLLNILDQLRADAFSFSLIERIVVAKHMHHSLYTNSHRTVPTLLPKFKANP